MNVKDMEKVDCKYCGGVFLMAQAVVLDDRGEFKYYCSRDCAFGRIGSKPSMPKPAAKNIG